MSNDIQLKKHNLSLIYGDIRKDTESICSRLELDDFQIQSIVETSPPKWHIAHVSWFFETFVLSQYSSHYRVFHPQFAYLFNSYYETVGSMQPRAKRGLLSRPTLEDVLSYRSYVDSHMQELIETINEDVWQEFEFRVTLGLNHEQQHQELLLMDIKHNFFNNPLRPAYIKKIKIQPSTFEELQWIEQSGGIIEMGSDANTFCFDNETPRHKALISDHSLSTRLINNSEYLEFIQDNGYSRAEFWLADGWYHIQQEKWDYPLYWEKQENDWSIFTLAGMKNLDPYEPVSHISFYEADAYARWAGKRLASEAELENQLSNAPVEGNFLDLTILHPKVSNPHTYGDLWQWTGSPYSPYPNFKPLAGSMGEYNGKFMCNQMTLRGGSCVTSQNHIRSTYRNFFYPHNRWQFAGIRLADNL